MISLLEKNRWLAIVMTILIVIEIFYFSTLQGGTGIEGNVWIPRVYHFTIFFLLSFFIFITIKGKEKIRLKYILIALVFSIMYAILDEIHQMFVPLRDASIKDILVDTLGIFSSLSVQWYMNKKTKK